MLTRPLSVLKSKSSDKTYEKKSGALNILKETPKKFQRKSDNTFL